jgi:hypothetical protein
MPDHASCDLFGYLDGVNFGTDDCQRVILIYVLPFFIAITLMPVNWPGYRFPQ